MVAFPLSLLPLPRLHVHTLESVNNPSCMAIGWCVPGWLVLNGASCVIVFVAKQPLSAQDCIEKSKTTSRNFEKDA